MVMGMGMTMEIGMAMEIGGNRKVDGNDNVNGNENDYEILGKCCIDLENELNGVSHEP